MKPSSRALLIFGAAIGLLAALTLVLVLTTANRPVALLPEDEPEGVVQRYLIAIDEGDYAAAWSYLSPRPPDDRMTYEDWLVSVTPSPNQPAYKASLGETSISGDKATVEVIVDVFRERGGLFDNPVSTSYVTFVLNRDGASWKITSPTYVWWRY